MSREIIWSPASVADLGNILAYLSEKWSNTIANQYIESIDKLLKQMANNPKQYPIIHHKNPK